MAEGDHFNSSQDPDADFKNWVHHNAPGTIGGDYEVKAGESPDQWLARIKSYGAQKYSAKQDGNYQTGANPAYKWLNSVAVNDPQFQKFFPGGQSAPQQSDPSRVGGAPFDRQQAINDYYRMMTDPNAPELKAAQQSAMRNAQNSNAGRGLGGGLAEASATKVGLDAYNGMALQRNQFGMTALLGGMGELRGSQGQVFDQQQSNQINAANQTRADVNTGVAIAGQVGSGVSSYLKSSNGASAPANSGGMTSAGDPNEWAQYTPPAQNQTEPGTPSWDKGGGI